MYVPRHFEESDPDLLLEHMRANPLATLVTSDLDANHIPLVVEPTPPPFGRLLGHVARANPMWRSGDRDVLAIFHGPQAYVSPSWYATKAETGKVVPTWNYAVVHASGRMIVHDEPAWIRDQIEALTDTQESAMSKPWHVGDAPADYVEAMLRAIVGIEIVVTTLTGKWKVSQNQPAANRAGVAAALERRNETAMAALVRPSAEHGQIG